MSGARRAVLGVVVALLVGIGYERFAPDPPDRLVFLSVGQGDCALIQSAGMNVLIDAGPATEYLDSGEALVVPELRRLRVETIDLVLLSHPDRDHIGGLVGLSKHFRIGMVCSPKRFASSDELRATLRGVGIRLDQVAWLGGRRTFSVGRFTVSILAPPDLGASSDNDGSMFVRIEHGKSKAVLSGDAGMEAEERMAGLAMEWQADVLKAGHHGSRTSTGLAWLAATRPRFAVISCGVGNRHGHPHAQTVANLRHARATILRTDLQGSLEFRPGADGFRWIR